MSERRIESRYLCADLVKVEWFDKADDGSGDSGHRLCTEAAVLEDISEVGGCVQTEKPIPLGTGIMLALQDQYFLGHVCYCVYRDYGYFVGIRFSPDTVWNADKVVPDHLTNLQELACRPALIPPEKAPPANLPGSPAWPSGR